MHPDPWRQQILHWVRTGKYVILADHAKPTSNSNQSASPIDDDNLVPARDEGDENGVASSGTTSAASAFSELPELPDTLVGIDNDPLIPTAVAIDRVFRDGRATWTRFLTLARALPPRLVPAGFGDPSIMLKDVPALPASLPRKGYIVGRPLWHIPEPEHGRETGMPPHPHPHLDLQHSHGTRRFFALSFPTPLACRVYSHPPLAGHGLLYAQRGLPILTMCWSYILSARLLELQGRKPIYSPHSLLPLAGDAFSAAMPGTTALLDLGASASPGLVRWLCAILAPKPGWSADGGGGFPPWAAFCSGSSSSNNGNNNGNNTRFAVVTADGPASFSLSEPPPSSTEATELLIELCSLYGLLEPEQRPGHPHSELSPATAAFFAALALPFYRSDDLQPQFPVLLHKRHAGTGTGTGTGISESPTGHAALEAARIRQYTADLRYYMTLSMDTRAIGSTLWSIFWQPDIEANLVSPWVSSILRVLGPVLEARQLTQLSNVFAFRRPRVASWWLGVFLLGDCTMLDRITRYLETLEERWGFGSASVPDITVAAWTGSPQSFLDDNEAPRPYRLDDNEPILRSDLLQHRYNFDLQNEMSVALSWRPFGYVTKELVEPELWPWLERGHVREYVHWVWWVKRGKHLRPDVQLGFRRDTGRFVADVPDRLEMVCGSGRRSGKDVVKLEPSMQSTLHMIAGCMAEVSGDRDTSILAMPGVRAHTWLQGWRGLE